LSVNYNRIFLRWQHQPQSPTFTTVVLSPADGGPVPLDAITTGILVSGKDRRIQFLLDGATLDRWLLSPELPARGSIDLPVRNNPGQIAALLFRTLCQRRGIELPSPQSAVVPIEARQLSTHYSAPVPEIIAKVLQYSNNLAAELLGQVAARTLNNNRPLSLHDSAALLANWYGKTLPHTNWQNFFSANHSGFSTLTRHTPRQLADILRYAWNTQLGGGSFPALLSPPHWGKATEPVREIVRAKSGTMSYADGLVGYLTTKQRKSLGFVILLTDFAKRADLDARFDANIAATPPAARNWTERAKIFERALITRWLRQY
jgi:D-alanyl-D-alanine carboxypeptidase/D-alanyl-D-alanine-endopeptidase (penicillin-binding protein 4)